MLSDSSVVLTEDTDSFIIGDKIWVGGVKPGTIAYIGETQFAPGEWAGIVLDQPIGQWKLLTKYNSHFNYVTGYFKCAGFKEISLVFTLIANTFPAGNFLFVLLEKQR